MSATPSVVASPIAHDPMTSPNYMKKTTKSMHNHGFRALVSAVVIACIIAFVLTSHYFQSNPEERVSSQLTTADTLRDVAMGFLTPTKSTRPTYTFEDGEDAEEEVCENIMKHPDPCAFVQSDACESEGLVNWLEFRYCTLSKINHAGATFLTMLIILPLLVLFLTSLGTTADVFFVPALSSFAQDVGINPAVSGLTLVALGNASPDVLSTIAAVKSDDIPLVLGSLSGAAVCLSLFTMGLAIWSAPAGTTTLSKFSFIRSMVGYSICICMTVILGIKGSYNLRDALIFMGCYVIYVVANVIYLQKQEAKMRAIREIKRKQKFLQSTTSYHLIRDQFVKQTGVFEALRYKPDPLAESHGAGSLDLNQSGNVNACLLTDFQQNQQSDAYTGHSAFQKPVYARESTQALLVKSGVDLDVIEAVNTTEAHHTQQSKQYEKAINYINDERYRYILQDDLTSLGKSNSFATVNAGVQDTQNDDLIKTEGNGENASDSLLGTNPATSLDDEEEEDDDTDSSTYMDGITWPNPEWAEQKLVPRLASQALWIAAFPLSLLRWLSIPSTEQRPDALRGVKSIFTKLSPFFLSLALCFNVAGLDGGKSNNITRGVLIACGVIITIVLNAFYYLYVAPSVKQYNQKRAEVRLMVDSKTDQTGLSLEEIHEITELYIQYNLDKNDFDAKPPSLTIYQASLSFLAFISSVCWMSLLADQIVSILQALGLMFTIRTSILGLTILSVANSLPDMLSNAALAQNKKINTAYAAIFSAPILSNTFGFALALILRFITPDAKTGKHILHVNFEVSKQLILCWSTIILAIIMHCVVFPLSGFTPKGKYGIVLMAVYVVFLGAAVILEITTK